MPASIDITGQRFGRLVAVRLDGRIGKQLAWLLQCDCGGSIRAMTGTVRAGLCQTCGCSKTKFGSEPRQTRQLRNGSRLYTIWCGMKARCTDPNRREFDNYGGRGIRVCEAWSEDFIVFRDWALANGYRDDLSVDRIDNDGDYQSSNCRWATRSVQNSNRRGAKVECPKP